MKEQEIITYRAGDGQFVDVFLDVENDTVWLTQAQMSNLFAKNKRTISEHIINIFKEGELLENSVVRKFRTTAADGKQYDMTYYNLDMIISIGYRVKSPQGIEFRKWASKILKEYLLKGYAIHRPVSKQELDEVREKLEQQIENLDIITDMQFQEIYEALINLVCKGQENITRRPIGFKTNKK
ncbi:MAG: virulence RhuM family protein [Prevotellaceae bacterium]|jgi:hypothetical protein|nr:virulence RhuM family protein [Prevotellaceae bacterium]